MSLSCLIACLAAPAPALALQPLAAFLSAADGANPDVVAARATTLQRHAEALAAGGRLLPNVGLSGTYTRNAYEARFPINGRLLNLMPYNQMDGQASLTVPVVDVVAWARRTVARAQADMARHQQRQSTVEVGKQVAQQYFSLAGAQGVLAAAKRSQAVSAEQARLMALRLEQGAASKLEVAQADSDHASARQNVASAELAVSLSGRMLETLTGLSPEAGGALDDAPLHAEAPIEQWLACIDGTVPGLAVQKSAERIARASNDAAAFAYIPSLSATATERYTNASALNGGHPFVWQIKANLAWNFDLSLVHQKQAQRHGLAAASARARYGARQLADQLFTDYRQIEANRAKAEAARAMVRASSLAEALALEKRSAGVITQLDVLQARRDAFQAEVNRVSADADLLLYRTLLRLDAGIAAHAKGPMP